MVAPATWDGIPQKRVNYIRTEDERYDHPLIPVLPGFVTFPAHDQHPAIPVGTPVRHADEQVTIGPPVRRRAQEPASGGTAAVIADRVCLRAA